MLPPTCPICHSLLIVEQEKLFAPCNQCRHEVRLSPVQDNAIINEVLESNSVKKPGILEPFKIAVVKKVARRYDLLLDIGSAAGKFLWCCRTLFKHTVGLEVTEACLEFSRNELGLTVYEALPETLPAMPSVITLWHALEHIPIEAADHLFADLASRSNEETRIIICVPSVDSWQYRLLGQRYTYYDPYSHVHQFSRQSLELFCLRHNLIVEQSFRSFTYSAFGALQGVMNLFNREHNYFYYRNKRGTAKEANSWNRLIRDQWNVFLLLLCAPFALLGALCEHLVPSKSAVLTLSFKKR